LLLEIIDVHLKGGGNVELGESNSHKATTTLLRESQYLKDQSVVWIGRSSFRPRSCLLSFFTFFTNVRRRWWLPFFANNCK